MNTNKYDWGAALKAGVAALESGETPINATSTKKAGIAPGTYAGFLKSATHGTFRKGSYGITFTYVIEGGPFKNRTKNDFLVLRKADGTDAGNGARLVQMLMVLGLPLAKINAFKIPRNEHDLGDLVLLSGAPVTIEVKEDKDKNGQTVLFNGSPSVRISNVSMRYVDNSEAAA